MKLQVPENIALNGFESGFKMLLKKTVDHSRVKIERNRGTSKIIFHRYNRPEAAEKLNNERTREAFWNRGIEQKKTCINLRED